MRMSRILLLLVALIAGGLAAFLATRGPAPVDPAGPSSPEVIEEARAKVLVATAPIGVGDRLSSANMAWLDWPQNALREDYALATTVEEERGPVEIWWRR